MVLPPPTRLCLSLGADRIEHGSILIVREGDGLVGVWLLVAELSSSESEPVLPLNWGIVSGWVSFYTAVGMVLEELVLLLHGLHNQIPSSAYSSVVQGHIEFLRASLKGNSERRPAGPKH